jgi:hypothetical protein
MCVCVKSLGICFINLLIDGTGVYLRRWRMPKNIQSTAVGFHESLCVYGWCVAYGMLLFLV